MTSESRTSRESAGGDGLMFLIAMAIVFVVTAEGLFIAFANWWFMALVLFFAICAAIGVAAALVRLIDADTPVPTPRRVPAEPIAATRPAPVPRPRTIAH